MKKETSVATGRRYESFAACYLEQRGCRITERNFRCKTGEIDLIAIDPAHKLVFVEVRFRASNRFGGALSSVTPNKQRRIRNAASYYLLTHPQYAAYYCRFDVIALSKDKRSDGVEVNWIKAAFV
jgi:putative endonuclease